MCRSAFTIVSAFSLALLLGTCILYFGSERERNVNPVYVSELQSLKFPRPLGWEVVSFKDSVCISATGPLRHTAVSIPWWLLFVCLTPQSVLFVRNCCRSRRGQRAMPMLRAAVVFVGVYGITYVAVQLVTAIFFSRTSDFYLVPIELLLPAAVAAGRQIDESLTARKLNLLKRGLCPECGYDLRATPSRCPECGAVRSADAQARGFRSDQPAEIIRGSHTP